MVKKLYGKKNAINETNQSGGNPFLLKTASDLIVPMALTAGAKWWSSHLDNKEQTGGGNNIPILDHAILKLYMKNKNIEVITPYTLVPAGIIVAIYNSYSKTNNEIDKNKTANENLFELLKQMVDIKDLALYMKIKNINIITPQTGLPFAVLMGPHIFSEYVKEI